VENVPAHLKNQPAPSAADNGDTPTVFDIWPEQHGGARRSIVHRGVAAKAAAKVGHFERPLAKRDAKIARLEQQLGDATDRHSERDEHEELLAAEFTALCGEINDYLPINRRFSLALRLQFEALTLGLGGAGTW
jgi:hypothetical protein